VLKVIKFISPSPVALFGESAQTPIDADAFDPKPAYAAKDEPPRAVALADPAPAPPAQLNAQQRRALECALDGQSIFVTGGAGVGKSFTLNHIVADLREKHGDEHVFVTASTGIAACHIGGTTLHSFSGAGLGKEPVANLIGRVCGNKVTPIIEKMPYA